MPDFSQSNELIQKLLGFGFQKQLSDLSMKRQMELMERQNELYGGRQAEYLQASGEKEKDVAGYKHKLDLDKIAAEGADWAAKQPGFKRLMYQFQTTQDPKAREEIARTVERFGTVFGQLSEDSLAGKPPSGDKLGAIAMFVDPNEAVTYFNGLSANVRSDRNIGVQKERIGVQREGIAERRAAREGKAGAGEKPVDLNAALAAKAKEAMAYLKGDKGKAPGLDEAMGGEGAAGWADMGALRRMVSKVHSMASQKKLSDKSTAQQYFDFLDAIYENPAEALRMSQMLRGTEKGDALEKQTKSNLVSSQARQIYINALIKNGVPKEDAEVLADKRFPLE